MLPNILVTGTPGVGKSRLCKAIADKCKYNNVEVSAIAKREDFIQSHDDEYDCPVLDEDALLDYLEPIMADGGNIVEYHSCEMFPERWFEAVYVITCDNTLLFDRLTDRGYNPKKLKSNIECEIFRECYNEAMESYDPTIVTELKSETMADLEKAIKTVKDFIHSSETK